MPEDSRNDVRSPSEDGEATVIPSEVSLSRVELHAEVWSVPLLILAKRWGVSDVAIGKACRRLAIPLPGRGYWAKKSAGAETVVASLKAAHAGMPENVRFHGRVLRHSTKPRAARSEPLSNVLELAGAGHPHPLIVKARAKLKSATKHDGLLYLGAPYIDVQVSDQQMDRALGLLDAVFRLLERQHICVFVSSETGKLEAAVGETKIPFRLLERRRQVAHPDAGKGHWTPNFLLEPTGRLVFELTDYPRAPTRTRWEDRAITKLEHVLHEVPAAVKEQAAAEIAWLKQRELDEAEQRRLAHQRYAQQLELKARKRLRMALLRHARNAERAQSIRNLCDAVETTGDSAAIAWISWARAEADDIDPLSGIPPWELSEASSR